MTEMKGAVETETNEQRRHGSENSSHGWPDTKSLTIDISSPRPHHMEKAMSREQHYMMDLNQPEMNFSFLSLRTRKLLVLGPLGQRNLLR